MNIYYVLKLVSHYEAFYIIVLKRKWKHEEGRNRMTTFPQ
jgi:hypothetical protein